MTTTVRRTSTKRLNAILANAALITKYRDMETDVDIGAVSAEEAMSAFSRFDFSKAYLDGDGLLTLSVTSSHFYTAYPSREVAQRRMTERAFKKYFSN